jgi:hypothetical protein
MSERCPSASSRRGSHSFGACSSRDRGAQRADPAVVRLVLGFRDHTAALVFGSIFGMREVIL